MVSWPGDPALEDMERRLALQPKITVPSVTLDGSTDGVMPSGGTAHHASRFAAKHEHRVIENAGHNLPQEAPGGFRRCDAGGESVGRLILPAVSALGAT